MVSGRFYPFPAIYPGVRTKMKQNLLWCIFLFFDNNPWHFIPLTTYVLIEQAHHKNRDNYKVLNRQNQTKRLMCAHICCYISFTASETEPESLKVGDCNFHLPEYLDTHQSLLHMSVPCLDQSLCYNLYYAIAIRPSKQYSISF